MKHATMAELEAGLENIRQSPTDTGVLALIVRRPQVEAREVLEVGELDQVEGLVGRQLENARQFANCRWVSPSRHATQHQ